MRATPTWFSENPDKAWAERVLLLQSPIWMVAVGTVMLGGLVQRMGDLGLLLFSTAVAAPAILAPLWWRRRNGPRAGGDYWLKVNLWAAMLVVFGTYIGTHYFFDLMGMRYAFAAQWIFSSDVVGRSPGRVPLFMYPLTHAYFVTYYVGLTVAWRRCCASIGKSRLAAALALAVLSYAVAFGETFFMAADVLSDVFRYESRPRMLAWGSLGYAVYFLIGVPMLAQVDERGTSGVRAPWSMAQVALHACAAAMLILAGLEVWAKLVGPL